MTGNERKPVDDAAAEVAGTRKKPRKPKPADKPRRATPVGPSGQPLTTHRSAANG